MHTDGIHRGCMQLLPFYTETTMKLLQTINPKRAFSLPILIAGIAAASATIICTILATAHQSNPAPLNRCLSDCTNHLAQSGVMVLSGTSVSTASWTLIDQSWITVGTEVQVFDSIVDGVLVNEGCATSLLIALDGGELISLEPGESVVVGEAVAVGGYTFGCVCKCGSGWVFITHANCGGSTCACTSVIGPCIDPTNSQLIQGGVTGCKPGWGR